MPPSPLSHLRHQSNHQPLKISSPKDTWRGLTSISESHDWSHHLPFALPDVESPDWTAENRKAQLCQTTNFTKETTFSKYYCLYSHGICTRVTLSQSDNVLGTSIVPPSSDFLGNQIRLVFLCDSIMFVWKQSSSHSHISYLITNNIFPFITFLEYIFIFNNCFLRETQEEKVFTLCIYPVRYHSQLEDSVNELKR